MRLLKCRGVVTTGRGVTKSVPLTWFKLVHQCAEVHKSLSMLTNLIHANIEHHIELGKNQQKHDNIDLPKLILWFNCYESFDLSEFCLKSLSVGLVISDDINCDKAEAVGEAIQNALNNLYV